MRGDALSLRRRPRLRATPSQLLTSIDGSVMLAAVGSRRRHARDSKVQAVPGSLVAMSRQMADPDFRTAQSSGAHTETHIAPINEFVDRIRDRDGRGWVPYVAPLHGGFDAQVLSILRDPGHATQDGAGSGCLCVENDDPTAERQAVLAPK